MKYTLQIIFLCLFFGQVNAQIWTSPGEDFIANTMFVNELSDLSIDSEGETMVVSLLNTDPGTGQRNYLTKAYKRSNGLLTEFANNIFGDPLKNSEVTSTDLSADGSTLIIGRSGFDFEDINLSGSFEVYKLDADNNWEQKGSTMGGSFVAATLGESVTISSDGNTIAVGGDEAVFLGAGGFFKAFSWNGNEWVQKGDSIRLEIPYTGFGASMHMNDDGTILAVGANREEDSLNGLFEAGSVTIYQWSGAEWQQMGQKFIGLEAQERLGRKHGFSMTNDGETMVVGYRRSNEGKGEVKVYDWNASAQEWIQKGNTLVGVQERFGDGVNISGDGNIISVTGDFAIQMFAFNETLGEWSLKGEKIVEADANVGYGYLNFDGTVLATPGLIVLPDSPFGFSSLVRFYELGMGTSVIQPQELKSNITLYPNPTSDFINVELSDAGDYELLVTDVSGRVISDLRMQSNKVSIDLRDSPNGFYKLLVLKDNRIVAQEKFVLVD